MMRYTSINSGPGVTPVVWWKSYADNNDGDPVKKTIVTIIIMITNAECIKGRLVRVSK